MMILALQFIQARRRDSIPVSWYRYMYRPVRVNSVTAISIMMKAVKGIEEIINTVAIAITIFIALVSLFSRVVADFIDCDLFASLHALFLLRLRASNIVAPKTMKKVKIGSNTDLYTKEKPVVGLK